MTSSSMWPARSWLFVALVASGLSLVQTTSIGAQENPPTVDLSKPHPFGIQDMVRMQRVGEPHNSPDGQWIAFTLRSWDSNANKTTTNIWLVSTDGKQQRQLTKGQAQAETSPTWSPDSRTIAFVTGQSGSRQIWTIARDGGEPKQLTSFPVDVDNLQWSPDGAHIAFSAEVYPDADLAETAKREKAKSENPVKAMKFDRLFIRHWDSWSDGRRNHVFALPVQSDEAAGTWKSAGEPIDLMKGVDADCPVKPFGGAEDFAWSPDGREVAYTAQLGHDLAWSTDLNIYLVSVGGGASKSITESNKATDVGPVYSPDGRTIAFRSMARPGFESDRLRIKLFDRTTSEIRTLTEDWDRSLGSIAWSRDNKTLFVTTSDAARQKVFRVDVETGEPQVLVDRHYNSGVVVVQAGDDSRLAFGQDSLVKPMDIFSCRTDGSDFRQLTHFNRERMQLAKTSEPAEFHFTGAEGERVQAWILKPVGWEEGKKYPVAFVIHGGPQGAIEDHFHYRWNLQAFTGAGYAVVAVNFHGSTGFGQDFTDSISGDWGGKPFEDLMKGLDYALTTYSWLDGERVGALGASYGGWMINWINGHTNRFKCLVNHDGGFDEFANYFTTEELWFPEWEFKGVPWERPELFEKFSPSRHVGKWQTPTLVIHGANDFRLVDAEGIATFTALQRRGIPSQFLYFPDENHWVLKPKNSILWHDTVLGWLDQWLKQEATGATQP